MSDNPNDPTAPSWPQNQQPAAPNVPDYLIWSILATLFCCQPFGIAGIVYSAMANSKKNSGDFTNAMNDASTAKKLLWWSFGLGIAVWIGFVIYMVAVVGIAASSASSSGY